MCRRNRIHPRARRLIPTNGSRVRTLPAISDKVPRRSRLKYGPPGLSLRPSRGPVGGAPAPVARFLPPAAPPRVGGPLTAAAAAAWSALRARPFARPGESPELAPGRALRASFGSGGSKVQELQYAGPIDARYVAQANLR